MTSATRSTPMAVSILLELPHNARARRRIMRDRGADPDHGRAREHSSSASRPVRTPPVPMIGTSGKASADLPHAPHRATGRTAEEPDNPPYAPASAGRMVAGSMAMPISTLISESPSASRSPDARVGHGHDVGHVRRQLGEHRHVVPEAAADRGDHGPGGRRVEGEQAPGVFAAIPEQDKLTSTAHTPPRRRAEAARAPYSRTVWPAIETTTRAP